MEVNNKNNGFTLVEILVVIVIIMILTLVALPYFLQAGKQFALSRSAHKLAQDIRRAQEMSMSAKEFHGIIPSGGYGVSYDPPFSDNSYIIFADSDGNDQYNHPSEKVEEIFLERGIVIYSWLRGSVTFKPPDPIISFWPPSSFGVVLALENDLTKTKTITVNKAGLIEIE